MEFPTEGHLSIMAPFPSYITFFHNVPTSPTDYKYAYTTP